MDFLLVEKLKLIYIKSNLTLLTHISKNDGIVLDIEVTRGAQTE